MLMHTKGILVMTPASAMVLTGKQSLDFSGGVSAEDNFGIGGYARVMGPNGQAQYWAPNLAAARDVLMSHYAHTYVAPGELAPRRAATADPAVAGRHRLPARAIPAATSPRSARSSRPPRTRTARSPSTSAPSCARWPTRTTRSWNAGPDMAEAETAVVTDARIGGWPVCLIGIESRPVVRRGFPPADGPDLVHRRARCSRCRARRSPARSTPPPAAGPSVVLANLSGFDGSPESMRRLQLEYGAEIGRAIVNFDGKIVFCVVSRYHGGAFVVFSKALNDNMTVLAVEGSFASVIGGAPAAAVVFSREVDARTAADPRVAGLEDRGSPPPPSRRRRRSSSANWPRSAAAVRAEKLSRPGAPSSTPSTPSSAPSRSARSTPSSPPANCGLLSPST